MWWLAACTRVLDLGTPEVGGDSAPTSVDSTPTASSCVPGSAPGFELPSPRWGLAALHAERQLDGVDDEAGRALAEAGIGFCTPTYFLFQLRLDGHPVPRL